MNHDQHVTNLVKTARHCTDPDELRRMAGMLTRYGAWKEAADVEQRAKAIERQYAEQAAR